ncbi:MAG: MarR family transcriptional regulator [Proteobacteria bacterium]|jgi:DNA-binding MarR family transcriptional regulator|nr:MarR family transcriptional regulator [Pseudomonadota bacterium]NLN62206.1 MarR family transcriptional regulator [Myxococcales bacterium]
MDHLQDVSLDPVERIEGMAQELIRRLELLSGSKFQEEISYGQYKILAVIHNHSPVSVGNLGRLVGSAQSTTSEMVARLTKSGLVIKVRGPYDGRVVMVELTEQGRQLMRQRRKKIRESYQNLLTRLTETERESFVLSVQNLESLLAKVTD